ncbi:Hypothetical_protein [Hexamita inflata]|uniref:Hypothetical_protein n=1 Tax=Hexamita inflata TaxID=28002 RepID=A0AA86Q2C9_9EUKA|nr:Hypothetical protein HINF_LOCUS32707 [Hexamita inflata]
MTRYTCKQFLKKRIQVILEKLRCCGRFEEFYPLHCFVLTNCNQEHQVIEQFDNGKLILRKKWVLLKALQATLIVAQLRQPICTVNRGRYLKMKYNTEVFSMMRFASYQKQQFWKMASRKM